MLYTVGTEVVTVLGLVIPELLCAHDTNARSCIKSSRRQQQCPFSGIIHVGVSGGSRPRLQILSESYLPSAQHMEEVLLHLACSSAKGGGPTFPMARGGVPCPCLLDVLAGGVFQG